MKLKKLSPTVEQIIRNTFPGYRGRKWRLEKREKKTAHSYWDGGSRDYFCWLHLNGMRAVPLPDTNPFARPIPPPVEILPGIVLVENSILMGKPSGITIHCNPIDFDRLAHGCEVDLRG